jgi:serine/threonine protein kinase
MDDFSQAKDFCDHADPLWIRCLENLGEESSDETEGDPLYTHLCSLESRYTPIATIATGGMKKILRVHDSRVDRFVAMAQLLDDAAEELYEPFLREACLTARLVHPNIISIYNIGVDDSKRPFFTMELKEGDSFSDIIKQLENGSAEYRRKYTTNELLDVFTKICQALSYAHAQGALHLDLKPSNIQVAAYGEVKVCDWGLGRFIAPNAEQLDKHRIHIDLLNTTTPFGIARGTPGFMAPEQIEREGTVSFQTDIYSLGAILYTLLALHPPFSERNDEAMQQTLAGKTLPLPRTVPKSLAFVVKKSMARHPEDRYASVEALLEDIRRYLNQFPTQAEGAGAFRQLHLFYKRNRRICRTISFSIVMAVFIILVFSINLKERRQQELSAKLAATEAQLQYEQEKEFSEEVQRTYSGELLLMNKLLSSISDYEAPLDQLIYTEMIRELDKASQLDPGSSLPKVERAIILFILQQFNESARVLESTPRWAPEIRELAKTYGTTKKDDAMLEAEAVAQLLKTIRATVPGRSSSDLIYKLAAYDLNRRTSLAESAVIVEALLETMNPQWTDRVFSYDAEHRLLAIGGSGLEKLALKKVKGGKADSPLHWLRPHTLILHDLRIPLLEISLYDLPVARLDVRRMTGPLYPNVFRKMRHLNEIVVRPEQMNQRLRDAIPPYITITELADDE